MGGSDLKCLLAFSKAGTLGFRTSAAYEDGDAHTIMGDNTNSFLGLKLNSEAGKVWVAVQERMRGIDLNHLLIARLRS
jgi:hypothetical protein